MGKGQFLGSRGFYREREAKEKQSWSGELAMAIEKGTFENLIPFQFISFTFPNPLFTKKHPKLNNPYYSNSLRIAVLDSPHPNPDPPQLAAMLVPKDREDDWIFSTETGHLQLLFNTPGISRLILVGNPPHSEDYFPVNYNRPIHNDSTYFAKFEASLAPVLLALSPKSAFVNGIPEILFVTYEDNVIRSVSVEKCVGACAGEMLIEDVEVESQDTTTREFRRRLRFKRMPNLIQTEMRIIPETILNFDNIGFGKVEFRLDTSCLVHPYLSPMVASLSLIATDIQKNVKTRVLCIGVGGGAVLSFLQVHFRFEVYGLESDEMVMKVAKRYFGLVEGEMLRVCLGDGIDILEKFVQKGRGANVNILDGLEAPFDVIMVDLDAGDARNGLSAPPREFIRKQVLLATKLALCTHGILVMNVIPVTKAFYDNLITEFREVFAELYEINVGNDENYVLIASVAPANFVLNDVGNSILKKLKLTIPKNYIDCIRRI